MHAARPVRAIPHKALLLSITFAAATPRLHPGTGKLTGILLHALEPPTNALSPHSLGWLLQCMETRMMQESLVFTRLSPLQAFSRQAPSLELHSPVSGAVCSYHRFFFKVEDDYSATVGKADGKADAQFFPAFRKAKFGEGIFRNGFLLP
jgi:hypothetical protein